MSRFVIIYGEYKMCLFYIHLAQPMGMMVYRLMPHFNIGIAPCSLMDKASR